MYTYVVCLLMKDPKEGKGVLHKINGWEDYDFNELYTPEPRGLDKWSFMTSEGAKNHIFPEANEQAIKISKKTKLGLFPDRIENEYLYYPLMTKANQKMPKPSGSDLYNFLKQLICQYPTVTLCSHHE